MPCIMPVSDLRNYNEVLVEVNDNSPVYLTKNGRGAYAVLTISDYEKMTAQLQLLSELQKGEDSAKEKGWISSDEVRGKLGL